MSSEAKLAFVGKLCVCKGRDRLDSIFYCREWMGTSWTFYGGFVEIISGRKKKHKIKD